MEKRYQWIIALCIIYSYEFRNIQAMFSTANKTCHCTLYKRFTEKGKEPTFYIRIQSIDKKPLFEYDITTQNPYLSLTKTLFPNNGEIFVFDSSLLEEYNTKIDAIDYYTWKNFTSKSIYKQIISTLRPTQIPQERSAHNIMLTQLKTAIDTFAKNIQNNLISKLQQLEAPEDIFTKIIGSTILDLENKPYLSKLKLFENDIYRCIKNWLEEFRKGSIQELVDNCQIDANVKRVVQKGFDTPTASEIKEKLIEDIKKQIDGLFLGGINVVINLADNNDISKPFRIIYQEIQRIAPLLNVKADNTIISSAISQLLYNKYVLFSALGISTIGGAISKWGLPKISWPASAKPSGGTQ